MRNNPKPQEIYKHFKGNLYQIRCLAKHSETGEAMVVYQAMYGAFEIYVRPLSEFMGEVDRTKYPDCVQRYRFALQGTEEEGRPEAASAAQTAVLPRRPEAERMEAAPAAQASVYNTEEDMETLDLYEEEEELNINPLVLQFLDADTYERRLEILSMLHSCIDHEMINTMAVAVDIEIADGDIESRYEELKSCLLTFEKYECNRLR